jgi:hypothetical protein
VATLRKAFLEAIGADKMRRLAEALFQQALCGDTAAAALLLKYLLGRPAEAADPDRLDLEEFCLGDALPSRHEVMRLLTDAIPPELVVSVLRQPLAAADQEGLARLVRGWQPADSERVTTMRDRRAGRKPKQLSEG